METIFREAPLAPNAEAHPQVRAALDKALGRTSSAASSVSTNSKKKLPTPEDDCPICYETMCSQGQPVDETKLVWCEECGNAVHSVCFDACKKISFGLVVMTNNLIGRTSNATSGKPLTCVYCRARSALPGPSSSRCAGVNMSEGYVNLSGVAGLSPVRDTSSCEYAPTGRLIVDVNGFSDYNGPRRGQRYYGYQDYY